MLRNILGAVSGYIAMVIVVFAGIGIMWLILGGSGAFAGEGPSPSGTWLTGNIVGGLVAAIVAGWVALKVGRSATAVKILVGLVLVMGLVSGIAAGMENDASEAMVKPVEEMTFREAGQHAQQPAWYSWVIPVIGAVGVLIGGRKKAEPAT